MEGVRLQQCLEVWEGLLLDCPPNDATAEGRRHKFSVSAIAGNLARLRGENAELARVAGIFHDQAAVKAAA